jgi:23S rRNA pseudouridine1911/1915/1917 synthase
MIAATTRDGDTRRLSVPASAAGARLDRFLADTLADQTRSALRRLILDGRVTVDGSPAAKPGVELGQGMRIVVQLPPPPADGPRAEKIPLDVVHEDETLLVINKPAGLVMHPGHGRREGTLVNALLGRGTPLSPRGAPDRPGIVHRLDRETSGLVIVAKTEPVHEALVWGHPTEEQGLIEKRIGRSRANPVKMAVSGRGSREALTRYTTREQMMGFSLLILYPETGRTHQIRVHLQSIHHPIVGDTRYGGGQWKSVQDPLKRNALRSFDRIALHASRLRFEHPDTGREITLRAALPAEFEALLDTLRRG